jgi:glyoxylase-like metal-dependent hydrolase (beta-lactamase superfamily II)
LAVVIFGAGACKTDGGSPLTTLPTTTAASPITITTAVQPTSGTEPTGEGIAWQRVSLGFVSAYILSREGEAAVVDTGVAGSAGEIEAGLAAIDLGWDAVGHVILTHAHPDHIGSVEEVLGMATSATGYCGAGDRDSIASPRELTVVGDGDQVFGLQIITTPGHTPGHICVLDPLGGLLVAGDALTGVAAGVAGSNPQFTTDMTLANESVKKLGGFTFDTVVFGHGEPVIGDADDQVVALAAGL